MSCVNGFMYQASLSRQLAVGLSASASDGLSAAGSFAGALVGLGGIHCWQMAFGMSWTSSSTI